MLTFTMSILKYFRPVKQKPDLPDVAIREMCALMPSITNNVTP